MAESAGLITRKTRFVDLPGDVQRQLEAIERCKQVQLQIGSSIMADETERELRRMARAVQTLSQDLQVARMTLGGDRQRVEDARAQVGFAVKHAEKGASLVAHATDDGSWALSGLTPLQVAARQKALLALQQRQHGSSSVDKESIAEAAADPYEAETAGSLAVDPYEAVRRIQFASMHYDVASDYYWAWLARAEAGAQVLAERLDQLERLVVLKPHTATSLAASEALAMEHSTGQQQQQRQLSPRAVADVMQFQNESLLAIAGKVAALDDDVRRLKKKLGLKEPSSSSN
ncbi:hypothetical protein GGF44_002370 [Coemansia sp. RSA 1694]|nr:hypothetical protein GGF38_000616 [Coemansia sp. RSA 25]KAJ2508073.1 hypothetical protein IWW47_000798 [Coemansia sp. RSA 2052]KAJ2640889.1 hypothetical protein GGF44_002370 [Coemansia sp. RSA 1694]